MVYLSQEWAEVRGERSSDTRAETHLWYIGRRSTASTQFAGVHSDMAFAGQMGYHKQRTQWPYWT